MRAKKILLLSCLLPVTLFFVIWYANAYTTDKLTQTISKENHQSRISVTFTFAKPTPVTIPENAVLIEKPITMSKPTPIANESIASNAAKENMASRPNPTAVPTIGVSTSISITPVPTIIDSLKQQVAKESAFILDDGVSSVIIPSTSSMILEVESTVSQMQQTIPQRTPYDCDGDNFC